MPDLDLFDMDMDGDVDDVDFLGFDYLMRHFLRRGGSENTADTGEVDLISEDSEVNHDTQIQRQRSSLHRSRDRR